MYQRIRILRRQHGLTMRQLADLVGTSQQQIDRLEKGQRRLTIEWIERISGALNCDLSEFLVQSRSAENARKTAHAKVIASVNADGQVQAYESSQIYSILFGRIPNISDPRLFAVQVSEDGWGGFLPHSELIFSEWPSIKDAIPSSCPIVMVAGKENNYFLLPSSGLTPEHKVYAVLVKSIRNE